MRKSTPDLLKGIAVIMMVQVHLTELFAMEGFTAGFWGKLSLFWGGPPAAPVFMIIMGYFALLSKRSFGMQLWRGCKLILLGLGLNIMLNVHALVRIALGTLDLDPWKFIFGADILPLAGLSVIVIALLRFGFRKKPLPYLFLLILTLILPFFDKYFLVSGRAAFCMAFIGGDYSWSYFPLFPWLAYPLSGCFVLIAGDNDKIKIYFEKKAIWIFIGCFIVIAATSWFAIPHITVLSFYYHHNIILYLWMMVFIIVWYRLLQKLDSVSSTAWPLVYLRWVGKNVTAFYVFQWIIIGNLATLLYHSQGRLALFSWFVSISIFVSLLVFVWNRYLIVRNKDVVL